MKILISLKNEESPAQHERSKQQEVWGNRTNYLNCIESSDTSLTTPNSPTTMAYTAPKPMPRKEIKQIGVNHVVRVTVLGLAGITVDGMKCRDKLMKAAAPAQPFKMKAVVAFSRNSIIKGITAQSKQLTRSPSDDIVVGQHGKIHDDETATNNTGTLDRRQRHVAVWASDTSTLGSEVTFEANLVSTGKDRFSPMSFDLTIALAEDDEKEHKVALPFGVATLVVSGEECKDGRSVTLDLPVFSLSAASPRNSKDGSFKRKSLSGYPMIAISPRPKDLSKKRTALQRLFHRQQNPKVPSEMLRNAFADAYSMDANGDAILRVSIQIYEKGSELEKTFCMLGDSSITSSFVRSPPRLSPRTKFGEVPFDEQARKPSNGSPSDEEDTILPTEEETLNTSYRSHDETHGDTYDGGTYAGTYEGTYDGTYDGTYRDQTSAGSTTYATNEDNVGFFAWATPEGSGEDAVEVEDGDSYTLSFEKKDTGKTTEVEEQVGIDPLEIDFFGRKIKIPMCASLPSMQVKKGENDSVVTRATKGGLKCMVNDVRDDMTTFTADFFGKSYSIPVCSAVKEMDYDDDYYTIITEGNTQNGDELTLTQTYSTLSEYKADGDEPVTVKELMSRKGSKPASTDREAIEETPHQYPASVKDWLLSPQKKEKKQKKPSEGQTNSSPRAIQDFPPPTTTKIQQGDIPARNAPAGKSFSEFFGFTTSTKEIPVTYEPYQAEVPPIITPDEDASIGELTANTHEMNIASEAVILERYRKKFHDKQKREREPSRMMILPVAFGGDGMCPGATAASSPIRVTSGGSNSMLDGNVRSKENYFAEYDDISIVSPAGGDRLSPRRDPAPRLKEHETLLAFKPIELTITGYQSDNSMVS